MKFFITLLILSFILSSAYAQGTNQVIPNPEGLYNNIPVKRVITGDTIELVNGERVRLIGIDCPETDTPEGQLVTEFVKGIIKEGQGVRLEVDVQQMDKNGRLLAYVFSDYENFDERYHYVYGDVYGKGAVRQIFVNATLIKAGYAQPFFTPPNVKYAKLFEELAHEAKVNKRGIYKESSIPLGPESEKFFDGVVERLQNQPASDEPMMGEK